jgi:hypothetical protein
VTGARRWSTTTLQTILRSPRVAGLRCHRGEVVAKGQWAPIITVEEHERLLAVTVKRPGRKTKSAARTLPLVGFLRCGKCGNQLRSLVGAEQGRRRRYACRPGDNLGGCGGIQVSADAVEQEVRTYVCTVLSHPKTRRKLAAAAPKPDSKCESRLFEQIRELDLKRQRLTDLTVDGMLSPAEYARKHAELNGQYETLERALTALPEQQALVALPQTKTEIEMAWDERGINFQRLLIGLTIDHITINPAPANGPKFNPERLSWMLRA